MPAQKGAPLMALWTIAAFWILGRIAWEASIPAASMDIDTAEMKQEAEMQTSIPATVRAMPKVSAKFSPLPEQLVPKTVSVDMDRNLYYDRISDMAHSLSGAVQSEKSDNGSAPPPTLNEPSESFFRALQASSGLPQRRSNETRPHQIPEPSKRLSAYFWTFARQGRGSASLGTDFPITSPGGQYGGSQAGAILTYRLMGSRQKNLSAFARASAALSPLDDEELAIGLRSKPFPKIPISVFAEQRFDARKFGDRGRAFYLAGGTGPDRLIANIALETYGQAGYLFSENDSYFFDASATLQRTVWQHGKLKIATGAGFWAGGQEGVTRFDVGPRVSLQAPVGGMDMRFSLDWRQRIGGNAVPDSGAALTVTTGF